MFKEMEKNEKKKAKEEQKLALQRAKNAKAWATEVLPKFDALVGPHGIAKQVGRRRRRRRRRRHVSSPAPFSSHI